MNILLTNCVRHNAPGGSIRLGARAEGKSVVLFVAGGAAAGIPSVADPARPLEADGGAARCNFGRGHPMGWRFPFPYP